MGDEGSLLTEILLMQSPRQPEPPHILSLAKQRRSSGPLVGSGSGEDFGNRWQFRCVLVFFLLLPPVVLEFNNVHIDDE
jgi:hypothetical protein